MKVRFTVVKMDGHGAQVEKTVYFWPSWPSNFITNFWYLSETRKDYGAKVDGSLQEMKCSSPENLIGHPVTDIEEDHLHCWTPIDFIYDAGIVIWLIALCVVVKKRRIIQSIFWCCFGSNEKPPHALPWWRHQMILTHDVITVACCPETQLICPADRNIAEIPEFNLWWIKCRYKIKYL